MFKSRSTPAFILTLSFITMTIAACDTQSDRATTGGVATPIPMATIMPVTTPTISPAVTLTPYDKEFMMGAARSGMMEAQLGNIATQKASHADVKKFAQRIATDHSQASQMLRQLAASLNITLPQELDPDQRNAVSRMENTSSKDFDREFMKTMVTDHTKDVSEYERAASQATNTEIKQYASQMLPALRDHLQMARNIAGKMGIKPAQSQ